MSNDHAGEEAVPSLQAPALFLDVERYRSFLENGEISEEQQQEFLESIWDVVVSFVSLGFSIHPLQQAIAENRIDDDASAESDDQTSLKLNFRHATAATELTRAGEPKL